MGVEITTKNLTKSFGSANIWRDVSLTLPKGEVSVLLGPSGTGKSVFLKSLIGLLRPEEGEILIDGTDIMRCSTSELYEIRKKFGVLFQDGALFGSMNLYDNTAFPLREHTKKKESEVKKITMEKLEMVGLNGAEDKLPGEISGGMRKRAGLARALVLDPEIMLVDEPDSGLDPVRTSYTSQLLMDINAQIDCTTLIVTHNINIARTVPDNMGMLFMKNLVMFGPREVLLTSEEPVVKQFLSGSMVGPIGMSEEKDEAQRKEEEERMKDGGDGGVDVPDEIAPQMQPSPGMPERKGAQRRKERVREMLPDLPEKAQEAIRADLDKNEQDGDGGEQGIAAAGNQQDNDGDGDGGRDGGRDAGRDDDRTDQHDYDRSNSSSNDDTAQMASSAYRGGQSGQSGNSSRGYGVSGREYGDDNPTENLPRVQGR